MNGSETNKPDRDHLKGWRIDLYNTAGQPYAVAKRPGEARLLKTALDYADLLEEINAL